MAAYIIFIQEALKDQAAYDTYRPMIRATMEGHDITRVLGANVETMEGKAPNGVVMLQFPDVAAAHAWYESPAYQAASIHRRKGGDYRVMIIDGAA